MFSVSFLLDRFDFDMFHSPNSSSIRYRDIHFVFYHQLSPSNRRRPKHWTISRRTSHANTTYVLNNVTPFQASNGSPLAALTNTHARGSNAMLVLPSLPLLDFVFFPTGKKGETELEKSVLLHCCWLFGRDSIWSMSKAIPTSLFSFPLSSSEFEFSFPVIELIFWIFSTFSSLLVVVLAGTLGHRYNTIYSLISWPSLLFSAGRQATKSMVKRSRAWNPISCGSQLPGHKRKVKAPLVRSLAGEPLACSTCWLHSVILPVKSP